MKFRVAGLGHGCKDREVMPSDASVPCPWSLISGRGREAPNTKRLAPESLERGHHRCDR